MYDADNRRVVPDNRLYMCMDSQTLLSMGVIGHIATNDEVSTTRWRHYMYVKYMYTIYNIYIFCRNSDAPILLLSWVMSCLIMDLRVRISIES